MKPGCILQTTILSVFLLFGVGIAQAQYDTEILRAKIPFAFNIGQHSYAPGDYSLKRSLQHTLMLRDDRGVTLTSIATNPMEALVAPNTGKLVFNGYNGRYFLSQIWEPGNTNGQEVIKSPVEKEIVRTPPELNEISLITH